MKLHSLTVFFLFLGFYVFKCQAPDLRPDLSGRTFDHNAIRDYANNWSNNTVRATSIDELKKIAGGSPYYDANFYTAKVNNGMVVPHKLRYNAYSDAMEYMKGDTTYELVKLEGLEIIFPEANMRFALKKVENNGSFELHYVQPVIEGKYGLWKQQKINLSGGDGQDNGIIDRSRYQFKNTPVTYYYSVGNGDLYKLPTTKNKLVEAFHTEASAIQQYFKNNKVNFKREEQLAGLFRFLNQ